MVNTMNIHLRGAMREVLLLVCCVLLAGVTSGQTVQDQPRKRLYEVDRANVADAIAKVKSGDFAGVHVDLIGRAGAVEAIPILREQFVRIQDPLDKAKIAQVLIKLGDKDDTYWDFLVKLATPALESDAPDFMSYDSQGKSVPGPSPEFVAWAEAHNLPHSSAGEDSVYVLPGKVGLLGLTGDSKAIPLLRRALSSPNHMIETMAALGLAEIQDKDSIPLIIEACKRAPAEAAAVMAESLVYFDDAEAQRAVDTYIPKDAAKVFRQARAQGKKTPWSY
jgi:HEAT repeats